MLYFILILIALFALGDKNIALKIICKFVKEENKWNKVKSLVMHFSVSK